MADSEWRIVWERATTLLHAQALHIDPYLTLSIRCRLSPGYPLRDESQY
jgi:hypothetical protein